LDFERLLWQEQDLLQERESLGAAREILREMLVLMANQLDCRPILAPLIDDLLSVRATLRERRQWQAADALRDSLQKAGVVVEDTQDGAKWYVRE
jgi:cysteinyl-tRNA synthetase